MERGVQQWHSHEETGTGHTGDRVGAVARASFPAQVTVHGHCKRRGARAAQYQHHRGQPQARRRVAIVPPQQDMPEDHRHTVGLAEW